MVECQLPKLDVVGSSPISRSKKSITCKRPASVICSFLLHFTLYASFSAFSSALTAVCRRSSEERVYVF